MRAKPARRSASGEGGRARVVHRKRRVVRKAMGEGEGGRVVHRKRRVVRKAMGEGGTIPKGSAKAVTLALKNAVRDSPRGTISLRGVRHVLAVKGLAVQKQRKLSEWNIFVKDNFHSAPGSTAAQRLRWLGAEYRKYESAPVSQMD